MNEREQLLTYAEAGKVCSLSEASIRRRIKEGRFPRPIVIAKTKSGRAARTAFIASEVHAVVREMIAADRGTSPVPEA